MTMQHDMEIRTQVLKGTVQSIDDAGQVQVVTVKLDDLGSRDIEMAQPYGEAGVPPVDGALAFVAAIGGDPAHLAIVALMNPSYRFGALQSGEKVVYDASGQRLHFRQGGVTEIHAGGTLAVFAPTVTIQAPGADAQVTIDGNLTVTGDISDQNGAHGTLNTLRSDYNEHTHAEPGTSGPTPITL